jgi:methionyl-tRNA formyltransferase
LTSEIDAGPVYVQKAVKLNGSEAKPELAKLLLNEGSQLLIEHLEAILAGSLKPKPQDETEATFTRLLSKKDGEADFGQPADLIERQVRAFLDFPKSRAKVFGREIVITKARVSSGESDGNLVIKCQPGYLEIVELTAPSGRTMSGAEFIRGYKK